MLNPLLYNILKQICGDVRVSNEGQKRIAKVGPDGKEVVTQYGESYYVDCWMCDDTKHRLSISYKLFSKKRMSTSTFDYVYHCFNEGCAISTSKVYERIRKAVENGAQDQRLLEAIPKTTEQAVRVDWHLPIGYTPLVELPDGHPALEFIATKYPSFSPAYLWKCYRVGYTDKYDPDYKLARNRIVFPVFGATGELVGWQGRTIDKDNPMRWYLPPGFSKEHIFNVNAVPSTDVPVIAEGIPAAIACGTKGVCIFGKEMSDARAKKFAERWRSAIIALDPETFVPDLRVKKDPKPVYAHQLKEVLDRHLRQPATLISWPADALEVARRKVGGAKVAVPDPADVGLLGMRHIIQEAYERGGY